MLARRSKLPDKTQTQSRRQPLPQDRQVFIQRLELTVDVALVPVHQHLEGGLLLLVRKNVSSVPTCVRRHRQQKTLRAVIQKVIGFEKVVMLS